MIGRSDAGHSGSGDMEEGVTLDVPSFSSLRFISLLPYFFTSLDLGPVQMALTQVFNTCGDKSFGGGVSLRTRSSK